MSNKLVVANHNQIKFLCLFDEYDHMVECHPFKASAGSSVGNIYIGVIQNKIKGVGGYFVNYGAEKNGFLPITKDTNNLSPGQSVMVQVEKDPYATKGAKLTTKVSIAGQYLVLVTDNRRILFSSKLKEDARTKGIKSIINGRKPEDVGFIVRTNCYNAENGAISEEVDRLISIYSQLMEYSEFKKNYSMVYNNNSGWIKKVQNMNQALLEEVVVDCKDDFELIESEIGNGSLHNNISVNLVEDVFNKMDLPEYIGKTRKRKVWLSSGGSIVIDRTEAMTVIDVNSGKNAKKINTGRNRLKINKEAAKKSLEEIRVRNLSGIVLIDFIDMANESDKLELTNYCMELALMDSRRVTVHGLTALHIMEITRQRQTPSLDEQLSEVAYEA